MPTKPNKKDLVVNSNVAFVSDHCLIHEAVQMMVDKKISSVLVHDDADKVVGIITERDIVRKFTLLDVADKLERTVSTIMSRPIQFARLTHLNEDIIRLHLEARYRHFPVLKDPEPIVENIVGIVSITDFLKQFILPGVSVTQSLVPEKNAKVQHWVGVLCKYEKHAETYIELFTKLGVRVVGIKDFGKFIHEYEKMKPTLLFDMDGYSGRDLNDNIMITKKYSGNLIIATSNPNMIPLFQKYLDPGHQIIAMKPIDISYCYWMITSKWKV